MNETTSLVLKSDSQGRVRTPASQREALLNEYDRSGLSAPRFAAMVGVKYPTFITWVHNRKKKALELSAAPAPEPLPKPAAPLRFIEAVKAVKPEPVVHQAAALSVQLPGYAILQITDERQITLAVQLLQALGQGGESC